MTGHFAGGLGANRRRFLRTVLRGSAVAALGARVLLVAGAATHIRVALF